MPRFSQQPGFLSQLHGIGDIHQRRCPVLPEASGKCARHSRAHLFITSVIRAHYVGHPCSLRRFPLLMYAVMRTHVYGLMYVTSHSPQNETTSSQKTRYLQPYF